MLCSQSKYKFVNMKKETLQNIVYSPLHLWFKLHAILPMRILYILSDIYIFLYITSFITGKN